MLCLYFEMNVISLFCFQRSRYTSSIQTKFFLVIFFLGDLEVDGEVIIKTQTVTVSKDQILPQTMAGGPAMEAQETGR